MAAEDAGAVEAVAETDSIGELGGGRCFRAGHLTNSRFIEKRKVKKNLPAARSVPQRLSSLFLEPDTTRRL